MKSILYLAAGLLAILQSAVALAVQRRASSDSFKLYAYGIKNDMSPGLSVFIADGLAYAGNSAPSNASEVANITITTDDSTSGTWLVSADTANNISWSGTHWAFESSSGSSLESVGVASNSSGTTTGFGLYGAWAYHLSDDGDIQMNYRATPTEKDGLYRIQWNPSGTTDDDSLLINLRTESPVAMTDKN